MRHICRLLIVVSFWLNVTSAVAQIVNIPDPNLRAKIEEALGKASGAAITTADMAALTQFYAENDNISNLTGLEYAINLTKLNLGSGGQDRINSNSVSDLSPLSGLTNLTSLELADNSISDISPLSGLTNLTRLDLSHNSISDILLLSRLTNLTRLDLSHNSISDISPLSGLTNLTTFLDLNRNSISDISPLSRLTNLTELHLHNNTISDISAVSGLTKLTILFLWKNKVSDISPLSGLTNLTWLVLYNNSISDLSPLVSNTGLGSGDSVEVQRNPLNAVSVNTHIPTLQSRGVQIHFDAVSVADVNGDGVVNLQDMMFVGERFGQTGNNRADVSGDGVVTIHDMMLVAAALTDTTGTAPTPHPQDLAPLTAADVEGWIAQAQQMALTDPTFLRGVAVLKQLLSVLMPEETVLLPNYPNPFNPETWIPYHLAAAADVQITIYDLQGAVVRRLALGHRSAGYYTNQSHAAYWDGRNESGEPVASGVYFYQLRAADYTATRRMVIVK